MARSQGRPRAEAGPLVTRAELVAIAARVIGEHGFDRASIRLIAKEAGVSYGTVQYHFATKSELWRAVVDEIIVPAYFEARSIPPPGGIDILLEEDIKKRLDFVALRPGLSAAILADRSEGNRERLAYLADALAEIRRVDQTFVRELQSAGHLRDFSVDALLVLLAIGISSLSSCSLATQLLFGVDIEVQEEREQLAVSLADILLYGLVPRGQADG